MNVLSSGWFRRAALVALFVTVSLPALAQTLLGTAFTYQGRLTEVGKPANGLHDFRFHLFDAPLGGTQVGSTLCVDNVIVLGGLFTLQLDFGQQYATPAMRFLEVEVRTDSGLNCSNLAGFVVLVPRQQLTATPLASHANSAFALDAADGSPANAVLVDNTGKVGVGVAAPQAALHVQSTIDEPTPGEGVRIQGHGAGVASVGYLSFYDNAGTPIGYVGDGSTSDSATYLTSYTSKVHIYTPVGAALTVGDNGNVGVGTTTPTTKLDVRGDIALGNGGQFQAVASGEQLRIVRGVASAGGGLIYGSGGSVTRIATGTYRINFSQAFTDTPTITANAWPSPGQARGPYVVIIDEVTPSSADLRVYWAPTAALADCNVHFMATAPR